MSIKISSPAFSNQQAMPKIFTVDGKNTSPPLQWKSVPEEAKELAIICEDPDAPQNKPFVHWLVYGISPTVKGLPQGVGDHKASVREPIRIHQGQNSWGEAKYGGPMPPIGHGVHRYQFVIYALDVRLALRDGITKAEFLRRAAGHIIQTDMLTAIYERRGQESA